MCCRHHNAQEKERQIFRALNLFSFFQNLVDEAERRNIKVYLVTQKQSNFKANAAG